MWLNILYTPETENYSKENQKKKREKKILVIVIIGVLVFLRN